MLDYIWGFLCLISVICAVICGRAEELNNAVFSGVKDAVTLVISLTGTICFWSGIMNIAQNSGLTKFVSKLLSPLLNILFKNADSQTKEKISLNITANMLGISNAATPFGLSAMESMQKNNASPLIATDDMVVFVVINTAAFQLIPSTVAALRATYNSASPMEIITCIWISSITSLTVGIAFAKILNRKSV
ncbi:MAG: nucleoside recognition domain-containing protein [Acutalibacteraceae bacterium]|nr:nucleoside recognition domain-containing protein [Acutalibacteraceae bacterium]